MNILQKAINHPEKIIQNLGRRGLLNWMSDKAYIKLVFRLALGYPLNLDHPKTFNEKLQWLKLYDRNQIYTKMVDKYEAKAYVSEVLGDDKYIIPTLGVWDKVEDIDWDSLPTQFVLKTTHDSGSVVVCTDKSKLDIDIVCKKIKKSLKRNFFYFGREWPYKNVKPRIIAEQYMEDHSGGGLRDYKFFCFGGQVRCFKVDFDRFIEHHANYYDLAANRLDFGEVDCPPVEKNIEMPLSLGKMRELAEELSKETPFMRADFYDVDGKIYFGELTLYPATGFGKFTSEEWDGTLGSWLELPDQGGYFLNTGRVVAILQNNRSGVTDFKFFCFDGNPQYCQMISNRFTDERIDFYDMEWTHQEFVGLAQDARNSEMLQPEPKNFKEMYSVSKKLSEGFKFVRVDLYSVGEQIYFGELTLYPMSGFGVFVPNEWNYKFGEYFDISRIPKDKLI